MATDDSMDPELTFEDPTPGRKGKRPYRPHSRDGRSPAADARLTTDRLDVAVLSEIELNPTEFLRKRYQIMLAKEQVIIDNLYTQDPPDDKALTAALKRITDIGDSLKALPKQSSDTAANQKSLAEVIADTLQDSPAWGNAMTPEEEALYTSTMERADSAFGEGAG